MKHKIIALAAAAAAAAVQPALHRWARTWGANRVEVEAPMPGDRLISRASVDTTRAVTIDAPREDVWPWLLQMGAGRGGAYTYDWIDNLFGQDTHSADRVIPDLQNLRVGDLLALGPARRPFEVAIIEPEHALVLRSENSRWTWAFTVTEFAGRTRLISRNRLDVTGVGRLFRSLVMVPAGLFMESRMLLGVKRRAEALAAHRSHDFAAV